MPRINSGEYRLNEAALAALERLLPLPIVSATTTELQAGYQLGVQYVMKQLRDGFTVPSA